MVKLDISKPVCLVDEEVVVKVTGLGSFDKITLIATTKQNKAKFWSYGVFQANKDGVVDCTTDKPLRGTYTDADPMGLFWSLASVPSGPRGQRLFTINADVYRKYIISVFPENNDPVIYLESDAESLATVEHYRGYKNKTVKRIPIKHGRIQGTVFIPEGQGPFPGVIDMYGGLVYLFESRAALLASHGFVTLALAYIHGKDLPDSVQEIDTFYFQNAVDWFDSQKYVQKGGIGVLGLCLGGEIAMWMAENIPKVIAVVNVNGMPIIFETWTHNGEHIYKGTGSVKEDNLWSTDEGVVVKDVFYYNHTSALFKAWRHGAKLLVCYSGDDFMTRAEYQMKWYEKVPEEYKSNVQMQYYPGAGHLIEPPYMPVVRVIDIRGKMHQMGFFNSEYSNKLLMTGGHPKQHAIAQKDCWIRVKKFFKENLERELAPEAKL